MCGIGAPSSPRCLVLGHRGLSSEAPENTLSAFRKVLEAGADGVELDVRLARDGVPVVFHDQAIRRTTTGRGTVSDLDSGEMRMLEVRWRDRHLTTVHVPTLREVLCDLPPGTVVNVELKPLPGESEPLAAAVLDVCAKAIPQRIFFSSFDTDMLRTLKRRITAARQSPGGVQWDAANALPLFLNGTWRPGFTARLALRGRFDGVCVWQAPVREGFVAHAHRAGLAVAVVRVGTPERAAQLVRWGVDCVITSERSVVAALAAHEHI